MDRGRRWRNLGIASGALAAAMFAGFDLFQWALAYGSDHFHNDFTFYYAAARIGATHGWQSIYDLNLQQFELDAIGSRIRIAELARYISPPPVAWLALPFTLLPYPIAYLLWSALLLAALAGTWYLAAPGAGRLRLIHLLAALAWLPVIYALQLGQPGLFVAFGVAGSYALLRRHEPFLSGLALGVILVIVVALLRDLRLSLFMVAATVLSYAATLGLTYWAFLLVGQDGLDWEVEVFLFIVLASVGLPLLNGFIGEFLVLAGAFQARPIYGILGATGVIWSACYLLWMYQRVFFGVVEHDVNKTLPDLNLREKFALLPAAAMALLMGVAPILWLNSIDPSVQSALAPFAQLAAKMVGQ